MVGVEGFEPPTSCSQGRRATRLRYTPVPHGWFGFPGLRHARGKPATVRSGRCAVNAYTPVPAGGRARNPRHYHTPPSGRAEHARDAGWERGSRWESIAVGRGAVKNKHKE